MIREEIVQQREFSADKVVTTLCIELLQKMQQLKYATMPGVLYCMSCPDKSDNRNAVQHRCWLFLLN